MLKFIIKTVDYKHKYYGKGWHLPIYSFYVWECKQQARNADEWCNHWDLTVDDDSLSLLMRCRRVALVHELLWLTVGWSKLANRAVRLERSSSSIERNLCEVVDNKTRLDLSKRPSSSTNTLLHNITRAVASCLQVPQTLLVCDHKTTWFYSRL